MRRDGMDFTTGFMGKYGTRINLVGQHPKRRSGFL
jgi:hypothetical protein